MADVKDNHDAAYKYWGEPLYFSLGSAMYLESGLCQRRTIAYGDYSQLYVGDAIAGNTIWGGVDATPAGKWPRDVHSGGGASVVHQSTATAVTNGQDAMCATYHALPIPPVETTQQTIDRQAADQIGYQAVQVKKLMMQKNPSSYFSGKIRLFIQAKYGSLLGNKDKGQLQDNTTNGVPSLSCSGVSGGLVFNNTITSSMGIVTSGHRYFFIELRVVGSTLDAVITPIVFAGHGNKLVQDAVSYNRDTRAINEAVAFSSAYPDTGNPFTISLGAVLGANLGAPLAYGFSFNWDGSTARAVCHYSDGGGITEQITATEVVVSITRITEAASHALPEASRWSISASRSPLGTWSNKAGTPVVWVPDWGEGKLRYYGDIRGASSSWCKIHCFYDSQDTLVYVDNQSETTAAQPTVYNYDPVWHFTYNGVSGDWWTYGMGGGYSASSTQAARTVTKTSVKSQVAITGNYSETVNEKSWGDGGATGETPAYPMGPTWPTVISIMANFPLGASAPPSADPVVTHPAVTAGAMASSGWHAAWYTTFGGGEDNYPWKCWMREYVVQSPVFFTTGYVAWAAANSFLYHDTPDLASLPSMSASFRINADTPTWIYNNTGGGIIPTSVDVLNINYDALVSGVWQLNIGSLIIIDNHLQGWGWGYNNGVPGLVVTSKLGTRSWVSKSAVVIPFYDCSGAHVFQSDTTSEPATYTGRAVAVTQVCNTLHFPRAPSAAMELYLKWDKFKTVVDANSMESVTVVAAGATNSYLNGAYCGWAPQPVYLTPAGLSSLHGQIFIRDVLVAHYQHGQVTAFSSAVHADTFATFVDVSQQGGYTTSGTFVGFA